jgi:hypothetical protein
MNAILVGQFTAACVGLGVGASVAWIVEEMHYRHHRIKETAVVVPTQHLRDTVLPEKDYKAAMATAATHFTADLEATSTLVNDEIKRLSTDIISEEMEGYRTGLKELRQQSLTIMQSINDEATQLQASIQKDVAKEMEEEKSKLVKLMDKRLGEAVGSFLIETLQHNVDLGAQSAYLTQMLEEHKADLKAAVTNES